MFKYLKRKSNQTTTTKDEDEDEIEIANKIATMMIDKNKGLKKTQDLFGLIFEEKYKRKVEDFISILISNNFLKDDLKESIEQISIETKEKAIAKDKKRREDAEKKEKEKEMMMMQMMGGFGGM